MGKSKKEKDSKLSKFEKDAILFIDVDD